MLDSGLEITLIDPSLLEHIGTPGRRDKLSASTVSNNNDLQDGYRVNFSIESIVDENPQRLTLSNVWSSRKLKIPLRHQNIGKTKARWHHLQDVPFADVEQRKVSIIIGTDVPEAFIPIDVRYGGPECPVAIRSCLRYSIFGRIGDEAKTQYTSNYTFEVHNMHVAVNDLTLNEQLETFRKIESLGTSPNVPKSQPRSQGLRGETVTKTLVKFILSFQNFGKKIAAQCDTTVFNCIAIRLCRSAHAIFSPKFWNDKMNFTRVFVTLSPRRPWDRGCRNHCRCRTERR